MSKGSTRRPQLVDRDTFEERWERAFDDVVGEGMWDDETTTMAKETCRTIDRYVNQHTRLPRHTPTDSERGES